MSPSCINIVDELVSIGKLGKFLMLRSPVKISTVSTSGLLTFTLHPPVRIMQVILSRIENDSNKIQNYQKEYQEGLDKNGQKWCKKRSEMALK